MSHAARKHDAIVTLAAPTQRQDVFMRHPSSSSFGYGSKPSAAKSGLRITMQYRSGGAMVYELQNADFKVAVHVRPPEASGDSDQWRVEAHSNHELDAVVVSESGSTRADALERVGVSWAAKANEFHLPAWDFPAIGRALDSVRAP